MDKLQTITKSPPAHIPARHHQISVSDGNAILAHLGRAPVGVIFLVPQYRLVAAKSASACDKVMSALRQFRANRRRDSGFDLHESHAARCLASDLRTADMPEAHEVAGLLHIHAKVDQVDEYLDMALWLHIAAHQSE